MESNILVVPVAAWDGMTVLQRVHLCRVKRVLFIEGMICGMTGISRASAQDGEAIDFTSSIQKTTVSNLIDEAKNANGRILNALSIPGGHSVHLNPLLGSGLDLEDVAYAQTASLDHSPSELPPYKELYWQIFGTAHTLSIPHRDMTWTRVFVAGLGIKIWLLEHPDCRDILNSLAFEGWDPVKASKTSVYEAIVLSPADIFSIMPVATQHMVVGAPPLSSSLLQGCLSVGGHFCVAAMIDESTAHFLHTIMKERVLTNVDPAPMWAVHTRICLFWLDLTMEKSSLRRDSLLGYYPDIGNDALRFQGWMEIVHLASVIVLALALDVRAYHQEELTHPQQRNFEYVSRMYGRVTTKYRKWRSWFAESFTGKKDGVDITNWEEEVFTGYFHNKKNGVHILVTGVSEEFEESTHGAKAKGRAQGQVRFLGTKSNGLQDLQQEITDLLKEAFPENEIDLTQMVEFLSSLKESEIAKDILALQLKNDRFPLLEEKEWDNLVGSIVALIMSYHINLPKERRIPSRPPISTHSPLIVEGEPQSYYPPPIKEEPQSYHLSLLRLPESHQNQLCTKQVLTA
ncbi:hypothetical protein K438DRAFT_1984985 [Mycena galopus ATCC 62051]|nr:hypothetical protein K438DRAFT_1984985 [Mycena galopus ATCC 62051]